MIEFYGELSNACKIDGAKRRAKNAGIAFLIVTIIIGAIAITVGIIRDTWVYALVLTVFFLAVTIFTFMPSIKRTLSFKIPSRLIIENGTISITALGGKNPMKTKPLEKVKKVIDVGEWYYFIFKFGDISNSWVCQKDLIRQGTIEEFEKLFENKIVRK